MTPFNAIDSVEKFFIGIHDEPGAVTPMYYVHALGAHSFVLTTMLEAPVSIYKPLPDSASLFYKDAKGNSGSLRDRNIQPNCYNSHYCFFRREHAESYKRACITQGIDLARK